MVALLDHPDLIFEKGLDRAYQRMLEAKKEIKKAEEEYFASIA